MPSRILALGALLACLVTTAWAADENDAPAENPLNVAIGEGGDLPVGADGHVLNLDFEKGTLDDWTVEGQAWDRQPVKGEIDQNRLFGAGKKAEHTGQYWLGGYEFLHDEPTGSLTSATFKVTHPYASFLVGGGRQHETRVELVLAADKKVFFTISGRDEENLRPVVVDLRPQQDQEIFIRIVDAHTGGWGHVNFDDFRFHKARPQFRTPVVNSTVPDAATLYPNAGLDPVAAAQAMQLPAGFSVQVGAAEPDIQQPIALAIDDRGRLWVAEAFTYPVRAPEGEGRDRVVIFADSDGNGTLDQRTVFAEGLNLVSGLEVGFGGVFVGAAPNLLFIPDRDGDDRPDGPPEVLLDGFGFHDTHEVLNSFIWGPDGWLYGCHGVFTYSEVGKPGKPADERTALNAGIWRYHPTRREFEVVAHGTSNPWGVDFNDVGEAFCTACVIPHLFHIVPGGRYERQAGAHFNPYTYDDLKTIADHRHYTGNQWNDDDRRGSDELGGGHAHAGAMIYLGGSWPAWCRDQIFMNNIHGNRMNMDLLAPHGSGYVGSHGPDFLLTRDRWSQMLYMTYGPDGQVWVIDWYDNNQCHRPEPEAHDRTNGRIYRIVYNNATPVAVDLARKSDLEFAELQLAPNEWHVRHARRLLQERAAAGRLDPATRARLAELVIQQAEPARVLRALWTMHVTGGVPTELATGLLTHSDPHVRGWIVRLLTEEGQEIADDLLGRMEELARRDPSPIVRLDLASAAQRVPAARRWGLLQGLLSHPEDAQDHNLPLMDWYALEPMADVDASRALALALSAGERLPFLTDFMVRRIGSTPERSLELLVTGLGQAEDSSRQLVFLRGLSESLKGRRQIDPPPAWKDVYAGLGRSKDAEVRRQALALAVTFGDGDAVDSFRKSAADVSAAAADRRQALAVLIKARNPAVVPLFIELLKDAALRPDAIRGLGAFDDPRTPEALLSLYGSLPPAERREVLAALSSRTAYALALLDAVEKRRVPAVDLTADLVVQLRHLDDPTLAARIEQVWGVARETTGDKAALLAVYKGLLASDGPPADPEAGRAVFARTCQQCHTLFGSGAKVGPDLTGSNRANLDYLLSNVLDPSAVMAKDYRPTIVETDDGRIITGIIREETPEALVLQTATEPQPVVVPQREVVQRQLADKSMMPDDLLRPLGKHQVRSLVSYLASTGQVPLLAGSEHAAALFNGQDLTGWVGKRELWSVEQGEIVGRTAGLDHNEFLVSELALADFRLELEVKLAGDAGNSGIQLRSQPLAGGEMRGYQADIGPGWWGKLYEENGRGILSDTSAEDHVKAGEWNHYEVVAVGCRVRTWINGQPCVDLADPIGARRGVLGLQLHAGGPTEVRFRDLRLTLLPQPGADAVGGTFLASRASESAAPITFKKTILDPLFRSEGVGMGDFNNDGLLDISAGSVWYQAPDWRMHNLLDQPHAFDIHTYGDTFMNWAQDLDGDGWQDLVVVDFPGKQTWWFQNAGLTDGEWSRHQAVPVTNNESPAYTDVDGDGLRELAYGDDKGRICLARPQGDPRLAWQGRPISFPQSPGTQTFSHGLGVGDINRDGRNDILVVEGWWEGPSPEAAASTWTFHPAPFGEPQAHLYVFDFDGDGDNDVVGSSAHRRGIWWYEQTQVGRVSNPSPDGPASNPSAADASNVSPSGEQPTWITHEIDSSIAQTHSLCLADINGDGLPDLVTGKRYYAHNGRDPGEDEPALLAWYELSRTDAGPRWTQHIIDHDSGVGTQFEVYDMDRDGLLDIIVANKHGVFLFQQQR